MSASEERSRVESALREANGKANAFDAAKARMEQEATLLQQHNEWLRAELQRKSEELLSARKGASAEALAGWVKGLSPMAVEPAGAPPPSES